MANGDITNADVQNMVDFGSSLSSDNQTKVDEICNHINAEVNLILTRLGFSLPITATNSVQWLTMTKKFGATSLCLDLLMAQDTEEENTRAQRFWEKYEDRLNQLIRSGGDILDADMQTDPRPSETPILIGQDDDERLKNRLRFPQRAGADQFDNRRKVRKSRAGWKSAINGL